MNIITILVLALASISAVALHLAVEPTRLSVVDDRLDPAADDR